MSPDMRILSMILKMDLMVMISKMATVLRKEDTVSRNIRNEDLIDDFENGLDGDDHYDGNTVKTVQKG